MISAPQFSVSPNPRAAMALMSVLLVFPLHDPVAVGRVHAVELHVGELQSGGIWCAGHTKCRRDWIRTRGRRAETDHGGNKQNNLFHDATRLADSPRRRDDRGGQIRLRWRVESVVAPRSASHGTLAAVCKGGQALNADGVCPVHRRNDRWNAAGSEYWRKNAMSPMLRLRS